MPENVNSQEKATDAPSIRSHKGQMEYRALPSEFNETDESGRARITGYMSTVNDPYYVREFGEDFMESFATGAFEETLRNDAIKVLFEHGYDAMVGRRPMGRPTTLAEDHYGARYDAYLYSESSYVREILPALRDGQYGTSIGFMVEDEYWDYHPQPSERNPEGIPERTIRKARLREFSIVSEPANPKATAQVRSITDRYVDMESRDDKKGYPVKDEPDEDLEEKCAECTADVRCDACHAADEENKPEETEEVDRADKATDDEEDRQESTTEDKPEAKQDDETDKPEEPRNVAVPAEEPTEVSENKVEGEAEVIESPKSDTVSSSRKVSYAETVKSRKKTKTNEGISKMANSKMTVTERNARVDEIQERLEEMALEHDGEELPEERQTEWDGLVAERDEHRARIAADETRRAQLAEVARTAGRTEPTRQQTPAVRINDVERDHDFEALRGLPAAERKKRARDNVMRIIERSKFSQSDVAREKNQEHVESLFDAEAHPYVGQTELAERLMRSSHPDYKEAYNDWINSGGVNTRADMALGVDANGGFMVPFDLDPTWILTSDGAINPLRDVSRTEKISGTHLRLNTSAGVTVQNDSEGAAVVEGNPVLDAPEFNAQRSSGYLPFSYELDDAAGNLSAQLTNALAEAKAEDEALQLATATGNGLTGRQGIGQLFVENAGSEVESATAGAFAVEDIYALDDALAPRHRRNATFLAAKPIYNRVRQFDTAGGADLWVRLPGAMPNELIGYPALEMSDMITDISDIDTPYLVLGDWRKYLIVDRIGMVTLVDNMVKDASGLPTGQRAIVAYWWYGAGFIDGNAFRGLSNNDGA